MAPAAPTAPAPAGTLTHELHTHEPLSFITVKGKFGKAGSRSTPPYIYSTPEKYRKNYR